MQYLITSSLCFASLQLLSQMFHFASCCQSFACVFVESCYFCRESVLEKSLEAALIRARHKCSFCSRTSNTPAWPSSQLEVHVSFGGWWLFNLCTKEGQHMQTLSYFASNLSGETDEDFNVSFKSKQYVQSLQIREKVANALQTGRCDFCFTGYQIFI